MAQIKKLTIQGIRSFGPDDEDRQLISFFSPLSLILGQNGCGKTTIIESLKYAITGEMPPGCKQGHAFVYDPKLAKEPEVRGKVQLRFTDVKGKEMDVSRVVQVTQKKTNIQFKTLDASISRRGPDGNRVQTSGRCVDVDAEVCEGVGVTKAVINNVILCHQEETSWPLEEGKKLKERFDAIFDTVRHNKCLKLIDDLRKSLRGDLTVMKSSLGHLKDKKEAALRLQEEVADTERRIGIAQDQVDAFAEQCRPLDERLEQIRAQEADAVKLYTKHEKLKTQIKSLQEQQEDLKKVIKNRFVGSIEDLKDNINSFQNEIREKDREHRDLSERKVRTQREEDQMSEEMSSCQKKIGQLETQQQQYEKCVQERNKNLTNLCKDLGVEGETLASKGSARVALDGVEQKVAAKQEEVEELRRTLEGEEQQKQAHLDTLRDTKVKQEQEIRTKNEQIKANNESSQKFRMEIKEVEKSASRLKHVEKELSEVKALLEVMEDENMDEVRENIRRFENDEARVQQEMEKLSQERNELQKYSSITTRMEMCQKGLGEKQAEYNRLKNKNADTLRHLLGTFPETGVKRQLHSFMERLTQEISEKNVELKKAMQEIPKLEANRRHKKEQVDVKEKELKDDKEKMFEYCQDRDLEEVIKDMGDKMLEMRDQKGMLSSREILYKNYAQKLQESEPCCPLCHRNFDRLDEATTLADELRSEVQTVPSRLRTLNEKLEKSEKEYNTLLQLRSTYERANQTNNITIPKLKKELREIETQLKTAQERERASQRELMTPLEDEEKAKKIQNDVTLLDKYQGELKTMESEIAGLKAQLPAAASTRSIEEVMKLQEDLKKEEQELRGHIKREKGALEEHNNRKQKLHEKKNVLVEEQLKIQGGAQRLQQMQESLAELQAMEAVLEEELCHLHADLKLSTQSFNDAGRTLAEVKANNRSLVDAQIGEVSKIKSRYDDVKKLSQNISDFERRGVSGQLKEAQQTLKDLKRDQNNLRGRHEELVKRIDLLKKEISGQQIHKRDLDDNLQLMEKQAEKERLEGEAAVLVQRVGELRFDQISQEKKKLETERQVIQRNAQQAEGRLGELRTRLVAQRKELAQEMYRDAGKKYSTKLREIMVKELAESDLAKYYKAMEWTMTQFHQERMKVINSIIHDLWREIYRGNDIDYIKIEANTPESSDSARRRNYEYKVVQVKNNAEIEMRSRCSAGQKVLACLIIRIALAETLSSRCGILALDEPTTNLDRENIGGLAEALVRIVNTRRVNKSFQLLIITHDEEFVHQMRMVTQLEYYHVVSRTENGKSKIKKHSVN